MFSDIEYVVYNSNGRPFALPPGQKGGFGRKGFIIIFICLSNSYEN